MKSKNVFFSCLWVLFLLLLPIGMRAQGQYLNKLPNNTVNTIVEDHQGFLWIGTTHGLCRFDGYNYLTFYPQNSPDALVNDDILHLMTDAQGKLWISTESGLCVYENAHFRHPESASYNLKYKLLDVDEQSLLAIDRQGVVLVDKETIRETRSYPLPRERWPLMLMDPVSQQIWVACPLPSKHATEVYMFDTHLNLLRTMMIEGVVTVAQIDSENCIWSIIDGHLSYFDMKSLKRLNIPQSLSELIQDNPVEFISLGPEESFIVGLRGKGVYRYNKLTRQVEACITSTLPDADTWLAYQSSKGTLWLSDRNNFFESYRRKNQTQSIQVDDNIYTIVPDHQHQIWFRSTTNLYCLNSRTSELSIVNSGVFGEFLIDENDKLYVITNNNHLSVYSIRETGLEFDREYVMNANILSVCRDNRNRIWMASPRSLGLIDEDGVVSIISTPDNAIITGLYEALPARELFLTTEKGTVYRLQGERFMPIELPVKNPTSFYMNDSDLVIGSYNEGVTFYNLKSKAKQVLTTDDNLGDIHVKTILVDKNNDFWFGGPTTISRFSSANNKIIQIHDANHREGSLYAGSCIDEYNTLYFARNGGLTIVHPDQLDRMRTAAEMDIILESFGVNGLTYEFVDPKQLHLNYDENMLLFRFISIDLENGEHIRYEYMLEGHDNRWIPASDTRRALYSQLPTGKYVFKVRARMENGDWSQKELAVPVVINPAPWNTWWARCIYLIVFLVIAFINLRLLVKWKLQQERLNLSQKRESMKQEHIDFMTNLSHEIRTPLMLIYAPLKELQKDSTIGDQSKNLILLMQHNAEKLKRLVQQIMSIDQQNTQERLHVAENRLDYLILGLIDSFTYVAQTKRLTLKVGEIPAEALGWYDTEIVEKILYNFLSNAIKYTPSDGEITLDLVIEEGKAKISVSDNGPGIPEDKQKKMFDRYERLDMHRDMPYAMGHGIGLHYSLFLARLHKGDIHYKLVKPHGSEFALVIPILKQAYAPEELIVEADVQICSERTSLPDFGQTSDVHDKTILVVEDNTDMLNYMQHLLSPEYNVIVAPDGDEALEIMRLNVPDIVITDVVMPHKNGFELCRDMRQDETLQLVPVLMLTAKSDSQNHLQGIESGANSFLAKPFDPDILLGTIRNMLKVRSVLQQLLRRTTSQNITELLTENEDNTQPVLTERDRTFMENLYKAIDAHLNENDFNVNELSKEMLVSYSLLYNKVKALTGETPQHFLTTYRLNRAMEMLKSGKFTVSEVCYQVGASSPANFSKAFKKQFGVSPSSVLLK